MRLLLLIFILIPSIGFTQIEFQSSDFGGPGSLFLYNRFLNPPTSQLSNAGADQIWDVSNTSQLNTHPSSFITPSEGIDQVTFLTYCALGGNPIFDCVSIWGATNQAWQLDDTMTLLQATLVDLQRYHTKSNARLEENFFGFKVDLGGTLTPAVVVYDAPDTVLTFPIQYGNSWSSTTTWALDLGALGQNISYESNQTRTAEVDAWGTIITPFDTFPNTIRVRSIIHRQDTIVTDQGTFPVDLRQVEYMWFDTAYNMPVMTANGLATDTADVLITVEYIYEATCAEPEWQLLANPSTHFLNESNEAIVEFPANVGNVTTIYWSFGDGESGESEGTTSHTYTTPGLYTVTARGCVEDCLPLNTCETFSTQVEILDTSAVSVPLIPYDEAGFIFSPNPANDFISIKIPDSVNKVEYRIYTMDGRLISNRTINGGNQTIDLSDMPDGILPVTILWEKNGTTQRSVYKIVKQ